MDAIRLTSVGELSVVDVPRPQCGPDEALLRIETAGVCGSDVGAYRGKAAYEFVTYPQTLGHEHVGTIEAVGRDVETVEPGDRVVERPLVTCGECTPCRYGSENVCENVKVTGFHRDGSFARYITSPATLLHPIPDDLPSDRAAMIEPLAVAYRGVVEIGSVAVGERVLVLGPGPIGCLAALLATHAGGEVLVTGLPHDASRLEQLGKFQLETVELEPDESPPGGFDVVIDATGSDVGPGTAIDAVRNGGRAILLGIPSGTVSIDGTGTIRGEKQVRSSYSATATDFERVIALQSGSRSISVETLSRTYPFDQPETAFEGFIDCDVVKPLFSVHNR